MPDEKQLQVTTDSRGVATVTLNRPRVHNAFDDRLIAELTGCLAGLDRDPAVRLLVLTGAGKSFSAGGDLNWMRGMASYSEDENRQDSLRLADLMHTLDGVGKPTVARVNGVAYGGGVGLVACCDIAVAADSARFCLSEARIGLTPAVISPFVIRAMGVRQARRYFLTAEVIDAAQARHIGLVHDVVPASGLDAAVDDLVTALLAGGPQALAEGKALIRQVAASTDPGQVRELTASVVARMRTSAEGQEGLSAFLEKRAPAWQGRD